jgi:hypothetical protein
MTRLLIVGGADDMDVTVGLRHLLEKKSITEIVLPSHEPNETQDQIILTASEKNIPVSTGGELDELMEVFVAEDILAVAWDESDECFEAIEWAHDKGLDIWDISNGLNIVDTQTEALEEHLDEVLADFTESLSALIYKMVMDQINGDGKHKYRRTE